jgi:hypothetical protein
MGPKKEGRRGHICGASELRLSALNDNSDSINSSAKQSPALPIVIAEWWRDRSGRSVRVQLDCYEGHNLVDVRTWWTNDAGKLAPGKGFACSVRHLPRLAKAIDKAVAKAIELGWIDGEGAP